MEKEDEGAKPLPDYYQILGVAPSATYKAIKKAYHAIARIHHPDRGNRDADLDLFRVATEAKKVLSTEASRLAYDRKLASQQINIRPLHENGKEIPVQRKSEDYHVEMKIDLRDVMNGATREVVINPRAVCVTCSGLGSEDGNFYPCDRCNGHGLLCTTFDSDGGAVEATGDCFHCGGLGLRRNHRGKSCADCHSGVVELNIVLKVKVPKGIDSRGHKITLKDKGHCRINGLPGDVVVNIMVKDSTMTLQGSEFTFGTHPLANPCKVVLQRRTKEQNILIEQDITLEQAIQGFSVRFNHLDGSALNLGPIEASTITQNKHGRTLRSGGFPPPPGWEGPRGTLAVRYNVLLPLRMTKRGREEIVNDLIKDSTRLDMKNREQEKEEEEEKMEEDECKERKRKRKRKQGEDFDYFESALDSMHCLIS